MSDKKIDWSKIPNDPKLRALIDAGYGEVTIHEHKDGITTGYHFLSYADMEAMGPEERVRLGVEASYQWHITHPGSTERLPFATGHVSHPNKKTEFAPGAADMKDQLFADYLERLEDLQRRLHKGIANIRA